MSLVMLGAAKKGDKGRPESDFYETPVVATESLLLHEKFGHTIWEPACGRGAISKILTGRGYDVNSTDKYDYGYGQTGVDFISIRECKLCDIVTNPPFSLADDFMIRGIDLLRCGFAKKVAFLLRLNFLEGQRRKKEFDVYPPSRVLVFSKRLPMMHCPNYEGKKSTSTVAYAWFVWERGAAKCEIKWI